MDDIMSWPEFMETTLGRPSRGVLHIGIPNDSCSLVTSLESSNKGLDYSFDEFVCDVVPEVYPRIAGRLSRDLDLGVSEDLFDLMCMLHANGLPAPVVECSWSDLIAAFHAFRHVQLNGATSRYVRVLSLNPATIEAAYPRRPNPCSEGDFIAIRPGQEGWHPALRGRQSAYLVSNLRDLWPALSNLDETREPLDEWTMSSFLIPSDVARVALRDLEDVGVSEETLLPGLPGTCELLRRRILVALDSFAARAAQSQRARKKGNGPAS